MASPILGYVHRHIRDPCVKGHVLLMFVMMPQFMFCIKMLVNWKSGFFHNRQKLLANFFSHFVTLHTSPLFLDYHLGPFCSRLQLCTRLPSSQDSDLGHFCSRQLRGLPWARCRRWFLVWGYRMIASAQYVMALKNFRVVYFSRDQWVDIMSILYDQILRNPCIWITSVDQVSLCCKYINSHATKAL